MRPLPSLRESGTVPDVFCSLGDGERVRFGTEVDRAAHTADFAADGAGAQLANESGESGERENGGMGYTWYGTGVWLCTAKRTVPQ